MDPFESLIDDTIPLTREEYYELMKFIIDAFHNRYIIVKIEEGE